LVESDMETVVELIDQVLNNHEDETKLEAISEQVNTLMSHRPLFA
jgi:glycine hydroxymethyltransferase